jgi:hypothetical protein
VSTHRELVDAQRVLNEEVHRLRVAVVGYTRSDFPEFIHDELTSVLGAYDEFDALRKQFDGDRPAPPVYTSIRAAKRPPFVTGSQAHTVLIAILAHWKLHGVGLTSDYLEGRLRKPHQTVSARINGLMNKGWIKDSGERAATRSGDLAIRWVPTEMALQWDADQHMPEAAT